jgi:hypothetical protein
MASCTREHMLLLVAGKLNSELAYASAGIVPMPSRCRQCPARSSLMHVQPKTPQKCCPHADQSATPLPPSCRFPGPSITMRLPFLQGPCAFSPCQPSEVALCCLACQSAPTCLLHASRRGMITDTQKMQACRSHITRPLGTAVLSKVRMG